MRNMLGYSINDFEIGRFLGVGGFARVYNAIYKQNGMEVAIKMIDKKPMIEKGMIEKVISEAFIHFRLKHPSILECYNCFEDSNRVYLVLEYCEHGTLKQYLRDNNKTTLSEPEACFIVRQVLDGIVYLHKEGILHRDLSPANLLVNKFNHVKIADFGLATKLSDSLDAHKTMCGTPNYISPEVALKAPQGPGVDVWGLGILLYELLFGQSPFQTRNAPSTLRRVVNEPVTFPWQISNAAQDLILRLLEKDFTCRISAEEAYRHPFFINNQETTVDSGLGSLSQSIKYESNHLLSQHRLLQQPPPHTQPTLTHSGAGYVYGQSEQPLYSNLNSAELSGHSRSYNVVDNGISKMVSQEGSRILTPASSSHVYSGLVQKFADVNRDFIASPRSMSTTNEMTSISRTKSQLFAPISTSQSSFETSDSRATDIRESRPNSRSAIPPQDIPSAASQGSRLNTPAHSTSSQCNTLRSEASRWNDDSGYGSQETVPKSNSAPEVARRSATPKLSKSQSGAVKPPRLSTLRLPVRKTELANMVFRIIATGHAILENLASATRCKVSKDGNEVVAESFANSLEGDARRKQLLETTYDEMPRDLWSKYRRLGEFVRQVQANTFKISLATDKAVFYLMETSPDHFVAKFHEGVTMNKSGDTVKINLSGKNSITCSFNSIQDCCDIDANLLLHFTTGFQRCLNLEQTILSLPSSDALFPASFGSQLRVTSDKSSTSKLHSSVEIKSMPLRAQSTPIKSQKSSLLRQANGRVEGQFPDGMKVAVLSNGQIEVTELDGNILTYPAGKAPAYIIERLRQLEHQAAVLSHQRHSPWVR